MTRLVPALIVSAPFLLTAAWCRVTGPAYRHVRVIPAPYDSTDEGQK